ncbi:MAG: hypothetical protein EA421_13530 [Gemmatimonadales bacterium]|nr:MAG: hypothetical protein EA421_13530 [Gemmatimonadales bacterium]
MLAFIRRALRAVRECRIPLSGEPGLPGIPEDEPIRGNRKGDWSYGDKPRGPAFVSHRSLAGLHSPPG